MSIFENDTVKSDCTMQENYEICKDLIQTVGLRTNFTVCSGDIKKGKRKKSSDNEKSRFFCFFSSPRP